MEEDDDDIYGSGDPSGHIAEASNQGPLALKPKTEDLEDEADEEEGEELEEDSDSDIDIITERKPSSVKPEQPLQRPDSIKPEHARPTSGDPRLNKTGITQVKRELSTSKSVPQKPGHEYPEVRTSDIDVNAIPDYEPVGKPLTDLDFDADLAEHDKPWRRPRADPSDYFNYGFDEFTWSTYCLKRSVMRDELKEQQATKAGFNNMFGMPDMPGAGPQAQNPQTSPQAAVQQAGQSQMPGMVGMPEMPPNMMEMMGQMMAQGIDPGSADFMTFMHNQMQSGAGPGAPAQAPNQGFGGQPQGMNFGGNMMDGSNGGRNQAGNFHGRGRGRRW